MKKIKRIAAVIGIVLISSMYIISIISAIFSSKQAPGLFLASIFSSVIIPIMLYCFVEIYKYVHKNDFKKLPEDTDENDKH